MRVKMSKPPPTRTYYKRNRPLPYCNQNCRTPRHWKFTQHHRTTRPSPRVLGSIPGLATYFRFSFRFFKKGSCQLLAKVCARSTGNRLGGLSLPRKSVVRLTDCPDMTLDVYRGRKTTMQQQQQSLSIYFTLHYMYLFQVTEH